VAGGRRRGRVLPWLTLLLVVVVALLALSAPPGPRTLTRFDPDRLAELEVDMWKAYYAQHKLKLFRLLVTTLREQYRYAWWKAVDHGFHWARAAATFGAARGDYDRVLPDLERGFAIARAWTGSDFDVHAAAVAELSWWKARRDPASGKGADKNRVVAARMSEAYAILYGVPRERVAEAARLRVEAADLRDRGANAAPPGTDRNATVDWKAVSWLLHQSYRSLYAALND
jgi:hypothetical protein